LIAAAFVVPWWERDFYFDSAVFGGLARSLLEGDGYRFMGLPHGKYPPGFPGLLAAVQALGLGVRGIHALIGASAVASVVLAYRLLSERHGRWFAFGAAGLTLLNHDFVAHMGLVLSDLPYLALSLATLVAARRLQRDGSWRSALLTAALGVAAASVRSIGITLAPAIALGLLTRRRAAGDAQPSPRALLPQTALVCGAILLMVGGWLAYGEKINREAAEDLLVTVPYHQELIRQDAVDESAGRLGMSQLLDRFRFNTRKYVELTGDLLDGREHRTWVRPQLLSMIVLIGWAIAFWRRREIIDYYVIAYMAILSVWSGPEGTRFLLGLLPFLYHYGFCALAPWSLRPPGESDGGDDPAGAWSGPHRRASQVVLGAVVVLTLATSAWPDFVTVRAHVRRPFLTERAAEFQQALDWVVTNTPADTPLVLDKAPMAYFLSGRPAYKFATVPDHDAVIASIAQRGRPVLIVNDFHSNPRWLIPVIAEHPELFHEIHRIGGHVIYQFDPEALDPKLLPTAP
jgi:hypothetical protein